ncbi:MAG: hypothetical protein ACXWT1_10795 [Methylobacter sp.]
MIQRSRVGAIRQRYDGVAMFILIALLLGGCTTLPSTSGYTAATIQVKYAVATTGEVVEAELVTAIDAGATTANNDSVKNFNAAWSQTVDSLDAMVKYAASIEQIVDAGNQGAESAKQVADSVKTLVDTVKVDPMSGAAAELTKLSADTVAFVYGEYSKFVAAKSLEEALDRFAPSMAKISNLVQAQVADARLLFTEQIEAQVQELKSGGTSGYGNWIERNQELDTQAQMAVTALIKLTGTNRTADIAKAKTLVADTELAREQIAPRIAEYEGKLHLISQRDKAGRSVLGAAENAIAAWAVAHQQLVQAIKERKPVSVESLTAAVGEIRTLTQKWREL